MGWPTKEEVRRAWSSNLSTWEDVSIYFSCPSGVPGTESCQIKIVAGRRRRSDRVSAETFLACSTTIGVKRPRFHQYHCVYSWRCLCEVKDVGDRFTILLLEETLNLDRVSSSWNEACAPSTTPTTKVHQLAPLKSFDQSSQHRSHYFFSLARTTRCQGSQRLEGCGNCSSTSILMTKTPRNP